MPFYEYICPLHGKFEVLKPPRERASNPCPLCGGLSGIIPSRFSHYWLNPLTVDGEAFTSKQVRKEELAEINQECRER